MSHIVIYALYLSVIISCICMYFLLGKLPREAVKQAMESHHEGISSIEINTDPPVLEKPNVPVYTTEKPIVKVFRMPTEPVRKASGPLNDGTIIPRSLYHTISTFLPFVVPPPFRTDSMTFPSLYSASSYYRLLKDSSRDCKEDICINPLKYLNRFAKWNCKKYPSICKEKDLILVMHEPKYLEGRVDIIENGLVSRNLDCGWPADHSRSEESFDPKTVGHFPGTLVPLNVPEGLSFQHFMDGVIPKLVQLVDLIRNDSSITFAMDMSYYDDMPKKIFNRLGLGSHKFVAWNSLPWVANKLYADKLILGCKVPPLHPELWKKAQEMFRLPWMNPDWKQKKHVIIYLKRGSGARNPGRRVINEKEVTDSIESFAKRHRFDFVVFNAAKYKDLDDLFEFLADVDVVIGPHGGAFYNIMFMRRDITVIEFLPDSPSFLSTQYAVHLIFYLQSMLLGDNYFSIRIKSDGSSNMVVNTSLLLDILNKQLYVFLFLYL